MTDKQQVRRIFVEKKPDFAVEAKHIMEDVVTNLQIKNLTGLRLFNRYDVQGITDEEFAQATNIIFSEPPVDMTYDKLPNDLGDYVFAVQYLPGQFDQRADSCSQSIQLLTQKQRPLVRSAKIYALSGNLSTADLDAIKKYLINPVEAEETTMDKPDTLEETYEVPADVEILADFISLDQGGLEQLIAELGLAMDLGDIRFCQDYFKEEKRNPTITEIRMIDTYWSDHCRHTTFQTNIQDVKIQPAYIQASYDKYLQIRDELGRSAKPICLMDVATIAVRHLKAQGLLAGLDESEEINACSVRVKIDVDGVDQDWLLMFKNETHNHPTEIEPFGGAATCLGGAIRDPLSGRSYVYQAMRVTGAANPLSPISQTIEGKLPQRKIVTAAAQGYSSYGNQIGLATGLVKEIYHPDYVAKRMEIGAVVGATPLANVVRLRPVAGDLVILLGGSTGRDGCGGATGSSKSHDTTSLSSCGAEVQKGNPPEERKIQRLFRDQNVTTMIKRCNDFGAGGVSVAIGELADGLIINLDAVPKKYEGLDGTELAISESQERMAVVIASESKEMFLAAAAKENLQAVEVAVVTAEPRLKMYWRDKLIVDISREFLNSNGAVKNTDIQISQVDVATIPLTFPVTGNSWQEQFVSLMSDLNICSQKGLVERFDSTIGAATVTMPFGGKHQLTPTPFMAAKFPVLKGNTGTASVMSYGFNPFIAKHSPYHGGLFAVVDSVAKLVAAGLDYQDAWLSFQEYFERLGNKPERWGKPLAALLGAFEAQVNLGIGAIGGKDSMSGTFEDIDVPPTLVSFAIGAMPAEKIVTPEFKESGAKLYLLLPDYDAALLPDFARLKSNFSLINQLISQGKVKGAMALEIGGVGEAVAKMGFGNQIGFKFAPEFIQRNIMFTQYIGGILVATTEVLTDGILVGETISQPDLHIDSEIIPLEQLLTKWQEVLEPVFPVGASKSSVHTAAYNYDLRSPLKASQGVAIPRVLIPVFPGTNCEYDTARQFEQAGAIADIMVIKNLTSQMVEQSVEQLVQAINNSQIIMLPGGFSGGDEPDGSGKFIATFFRNPHIKEAVTKLLEDRGGLMLGVCNGFQALIKLGLLPLGQIQDITCNSPTLTYNDLGRHQSMLVNTRIASVKSPWLAYAEVGDIHNIAISHGEGKFVASPEQVAELAANGQICTQYVDLAGNPVLTMPGNPNGSIGAIEGICSPDGRIFGKMGHSERVGEHVTKNVPGNKEQLLFKAGVDYFKL